MGKINASEIVDIIVGVLASSYGNLGYTGFKIHSIKPNGKKDTSIVKYSFIPRSETKERIFYDARIDIRDKKLVEFKEIKETELEDDNR